MTNAPDYSPYQIEPQRSPTPPTRSSTPLVLGIVGGILAVAMLVCCGGVFMLGKFGLDVMNVEIQDELAGRPEIQENIGDIESVKMNIVRSGGHENDDVFVYDIQGTKGKGYVEIEQVTLDDGTEEFVSAELTMSDGRKIPIDLSRDTRY